MILNVLKSKGLISPPKFLLSGIQYLTVMGSEAYGVSSDTSDIDIYGLCIPPKQIVFPHLNGEIIGFGRKKERFEQWQEHHVEFGTKEYDFSVYNIVKYFQLCMDNNPNMIDSLFTPNRCVLYNSQIAQHIRSNRKLFLHKGCCHKFKGYAYSQLHKMSNYNPKGNRSEIVNEFGYDVKFAYHVVRLLGEVEQILTEGDLDLERDRERLKAIRRGEWSEEDVREFFTQKERELETAYKESKLPYSPNEEAIKQLLLECLEEYYGTLEGCIENPNKYKVALEQITAICNSIGG